MPRVPRCLALSFLFTLFWFSLPSSAADDPRLGDEVRPVFQSVELRLDPSREDYSGSTRVELVVEEPVQALRFHAEELDLRRLALAGEGGSFDLEPRFGERGLVVARAGETIPAGRYTLEVDFAGSFGTQATGLYRLEAGGEPYLFTQFQADDAREAFPCWDEPGFKIPYQLTLTVPRQHLVVTNTPAQGEEMTAEEGFKTVTFRRTKPLPSYLLAIAVGPLEAVPIPGMSVPGRVITPRGQTALAAEAARVTPPLLRALEKYFANPYPYAKLDLLAVPEFWPGAMENAGAITFADRVLLLDANASPEQRRSLVLVTAHELAHMWFGDLVTMRWWDDMWLNESFASWMGQKVAAAEFPEFNFRLGSVAVVEEAMAVDARAVAPPVRRPVRALDNLLQAADTLAYHKGQAVLEMFENWLGEEAFRRGVRRYIEAHRWGNATAADLWQALSQAAERDVGSAMATFLDQPGLPLVEVEPRADGGVRLSQRRFLNAGAGGAPPPGTVWKIPVTLKYAAEGGGTRAISLLLDKPEHVVALPGASGPAWVYPNADAAGYYRWTLAPAALDRLARDAVEHLNARERLHFITNLAALLDGDRLDGDTLLETLRPFAADDQPEVVMAVTEVLGKVRRTFLTPEEPELRHAFGAYVRQLLRPALGPVGLAPRPGEDTAVTVLRARLLLVLGDGGEDEQIRAHARNLARRYLQDPSSVAPSLAGAALQLAALDGDRQLFEEYRRRFEGTTIPLERVHYLTALASFRDPEVVDAVLAYALKGPLRSQEMRFILMGFGSDPEGRRRLFEWMTANYDAIREKIPPLFIAFLPRVASGCSADLLARARSFFSVPAHQVPGMDRELAEVTETVETCVALRQREKDSVAAYLHAAAATGGTPKATSAGVERISVHGR